MTVSSPFLRLRSAGRSGLLLLAGGLFLAATAASPASAASADGRDQRINSGNYQAINNQWGNFRGERGDGYSKVILNNGAQSWNKDFAVEVSRPNQGESLWYPSIVKGWHYNSFNDVPGGSSGAGMPREVWNIDQITTRANWSFSRSESWRFKGNVAYDLWFHSAKWPGYSTRPQVEIMVWLKKTNQSPIGPRQGEISRFGETWDIYKGRAGDPGGWDVFSYVLRGQRTSGTYNLDTFVEHATYGKRWMSDQLYLTSVQFGPEVYYADQARFSVNDYYVDVKKKQ